MLYRTKSFLSLSDYDGKSDRLFPVTLESPPPSPRITPLSSIPLPCNNGQEGRGRTQYQVTVASDSPSRKSVCSRGTRKLPMNPFQPAPSSVRYTSPLGPNQKLLPPWARIPHAKPRPDLYRAALKQAGCQGIEGNSKVSPQLVFFSLLFWRLHLGLTCA